MARKIRFWHIWIYRLYYWAWVPILIENPAICRMMAGHMNSWIERNAKPKAIENKKEAI